jgi:hypothetical protein
VCFYEISIRFARGSHVDKEYLEALRNLKERLLKLKQKKASLLGILEDLEADGEAEVDALEKEIIVLQSILDEAKESRKQETVFRF